MENKSLPFENSHGYGYTCYLGCEPGEVMKHGLHFQEKNEMKCIILVQPWPPLAHSHYRLGHLHLANITALACIVPFKRSWVKCLQDTYKRLHEISTFYTPLREHQGLSQDQDYSIPREFLPDSTKNVSEEHIDCIKKLGEETKLCEWLHWQDEKQKNLSSTQSTQRDPSGQPHWKLDMCCSTQYKSATPGTRNSTWPCSAGLQAEAQAEQRAKTCGASQDCPGSGSAKKLHIIANENVHIYTPN